MTSADRHVTLPVMGLLFQGDERDRIRRAEQVFQEDDALRDEIGGWAPRLIEQAILGKHSKAASTAHGSLSLIVALDALPRILWRGQARAFSGDLAAQGYFLEAIASHQDEALTPLEQLYFYRPLVHAEDMSMQEQGITAYRRISLATVGEEHRIAEIYYRDALQHHAIVQRFGRFPERNRIHGRRSRPDEVVYLEAQAKPWFEHHGTPGMPVDMLHQA